nr:isochorismatase domain-containing protein 2 isoform X2 [Chrysemys picta bellii]
MPPLGICRPKHELARLVPGAGPVYECPDENRTERARTIRQLQLQTLATGWRPNPGGLMVAQLLEIPVVVTEQYPQGLGPTVPELGAEGLRKFPKTCFSMLVPEVEEELGALPHLRSVLLCGIETQACIMPSGPAGGPVPPAAERCLRHHQRGADPAAGQRRRRPPLPTDPEAH